ncbi:hypothetical protein BB561_000656 [Smittium simulii]|uniref:Uncharacterized protein n=1 Tax=Smittium simulii TaxID=133385 RepID=A0A2T9YY17_9FUNG|nr:hypothetical protein BB561_000656 [Smittium simulii]
MEGLEGDVKKVSAAHLLTKKKITLLVMTSGGGDNIIGCHITCIKEKLESSKEKCVDRFPLNEKMQSFLSKKLMVGNKKVELYKTIDIGSEVFNISIPNENGVKFGTILNRSNKS